MCPSTVSPSSAIKTSEQLAKWLLSRLTTKLFALAAKVQEYVPTFDTLGENLLGLT